MSEMTQKEESEVQRRISERKKSLRFLFEYLDSLKARSDAETLLGVGQEDVDFAAGVMTEWAKHRTGSMCYLDQMPRKYLRLAWKKAINYLSEQQWKDKKSLKSYTMVVLAGQRYYCEKTK